MPPPPTQGTSPPAGLRAWVASRWPRLDEALYPAFAGACVLYAALTFYGSMHRQTHGAWSAPLDDVFIHFDYARATARGYPFQWSEGNGYSSGNTSLAYPFVLALGYWAGFRGVSLMVWAAIVACVCTLGFLTAAGRLADPLGRWAKYLIPPAVLSLGALDWSLLSGMENAFHLGVWGLALSATLAAARAARPRPGVPFARAPSLAWRGWLAGLAGALLFAHAARVGGLRRRARGLAAVPAAVYRGARAALGTVLRMGVPGAAAAAAQAVANRVLTGEWAANGAIAKLALHNPYMTAQEKWDEYRFLLEYVVVRNTEHHFAEARPNETAWGWLVPIVGARAAPLAAHARRGAPALGERCSAGSRSSRSTARCAGRTSATRWRPSPGSLVLFAMGLGVILSRVYPWSGLDLGPRAARLARAEPLVALLRCALAVASSRCTGSTSSRRCAIRSGSSAARAATSTTSTLMAGRRLAALGARRVLVGDAGALIYASDRPGLDLIGLGGYHDLPFARAAVHGLGASLELIERMAPADRPDYMAIYPSWWGDLPTLFGKRVEGVTVYGNVICGDAEKVIYKADWSALDRSGRPRVLRPGERVVDELDVADLVSEEAHRYAFPHPAMGFVEFRVLGDLLDPKRDLFDAGRTIPDGERETARVHAPPEGGRLVVRTVVAHPVEVEVRVDGRPIGRIPLRPSRHWIEPSIDLPPGLPAEVEVSLVPVGDEWLDCHLWILGRLGHLP